MDPLAVAITGCQRLAGLIFVERNNLKIIFVLAPHAIGGGHAVTSPQDHPGFVNIHG